MLLFRVIKARLASGLGEVRAHWSFADLADAIEWLDYCDTLQEAERERLIQEAEAKRRNG